MKRWEIGDAALLNVVFVREKIKLLNFICNSQLITVVGLKKK